MKVSTRGRYGLRAMIDLAENAGSGAIPLRIISKRQDISEQYLEQLFVNLRKAGFVKSVRGANGGYMLKKSPGEIVVGDIIRTLEGSIAPVNCVSEQGESDCKSSKNCSAHILWMKLNDSINQVLDSVTLEELLRSVNRDE